MTVSRALSGSEKVSPQTRRKVAARAAELGYVKSAAATTIRGSGSRLVGLMVPSIMNEFYAGFASFMSLACEREGVHVSLQITNDNPHTELHAIKRLREQDAQIIVMVPTPDMLEETAIHLKKANVVNLVRTHCLLADERQLLVNEIDSFSEAVRRLVQQGHRHIAYIGGWPTSSSGKMRLAAVQSALKNLNVEIPNEWIITGEPSFLTGSQGAQRLQEYIEKPSALICGGFEISNGALEACLRLNLRMPEDIAFVGYGDPSFYRWIQGGITTISLPTKLMAEELTNYVVCQVKNSKINFPVQPFSTKLVLRASA